MDTEVMRMRNGNLNVIVTGTLGYDYIMDFPGLFSDRIMPDKIHKISLSFLVDKLNKQFGGTAGNIAYTLNLLGVTPYILSVAGNDFQPYLEFLKLHHLPTDYIKVIADEVTGSYFVVTDQEDNQIGSFYSGATKYASGLSVLDIPKPISLAVIAPTDPSAMEKYALQCQSQNIPYLFDPAFQTDSFPPAKLTKLISRARILIGNDYEISLMEKKISLSHLELLRLVPILITTLGSKGATIESKSHKYSIPPAKPKNNSDPTGAGDAFRGGFLAGYIRDFDLQTSGQMGALAAVYTVEKYGTITHRFSTGEFVNRYQKNYNHSLVLN